MLLKTLAVILAASLAATTLALQPPAPADPALEAAIQQVSARPGDHADQRADRSLAARATPGIASYLECPLSEESPISPWVRSPS